MVDLSKAKPDDLRAKIGQGQDLRKKLDEKNSTTTNPASPVDDVSNWAVHVKAEEEVQTSASVSEDPVLQVVAPDFSTECPCVH